MPVLTPRPVDRLELGHDVVRIPAGHPVAALGQLLPAQRMWIRAAGQRLTSPFCLEVVITLSRGRDLALVRVGMAFDLFLRPQHIRVMTLSDRLIVQSGGETFPLMLHRHCFLRPPNVYRQDRLDYPRLGHRVAV